MLGEDGDEEVPNTVAASAPVAQHLQCAPSAPRARSTLLSMASEAREIWPLHMRSVFLLQPLAPAASPPGHCSWSLGSAASVNACHLLPL